MLAPVRVKGTDLVWAEIGETKIGMKARTSARVLFDTQCRIQDLDKRWILMTMNRRISTEVRPSPPKHRPLLAGKPFPLHI
jgi:hypothetical protein